MAYTEPYPVITDLNFTTPHKDGEKFCYHFTLTYNQVVSNLQTLNAQIPVWEKLTGLFLPDQAFTLLGCMVSALNGATVVKVLFNSYAYATVQVAKQLQSIYTSIYRHMGSNGYKRVTLSQVYEVYVRDHQGLMINKWKPAGTLRVPVESYYYKY
ncbi:MAG: hypothetical protein ACI8WT_004984 [Clostridium sp.]|jgi:hypothetical protein